MDRRDLESRDRLHAGAVQKMTVSDLIAELQRYPGHLPVKLLLSEVMYQPGETDARSIYLTDMDAIEADVVRFEGTFVLVESK